MAATSAEPMLPQMDIDTTIRETVFKTLKVNQQDLDRNFGLATSKFFVWMQGGRHDMPWMQAGYRGLRRLEPQMNRRLIVASQMVRFLYPGVLLEAADNEIISKCEVGTIGKTSIEFRYKFFFGERFVGTGCATMIVATGELGSLKTSPVPEAIKPLAATGGDEDRLFMQDSLAKVAKEAPEDAYLFRYVLRFSDEDINGHANHSATARLFEDAREALLMDKTASPALRAIAEQKLEAVLISYQSEVRALDELEIKVSTSTPGALDMWAYRVSTKNESNAAPGMVGRGRLIYGGGNQPDRDEVRMKADQGRANFEHLML